MDFTVVSLLIALASTMAHAETCPPIDGLGEKACVANRHGWFYAGDIDRAQRMAEDAAIAASEFERHFGADAPRGAVVAVGNNGAVAAAQIEALKTAGANWVLPWLSAEDRLLLQERAVRQQIARQLGAEIDDPVVDAALAKATSQLKSDSAADSTARSALRHEIGHALLIKAFWADQSATGSSVHYGGPAPDWLDEVGAVLMEDATMADGRREQLLRMRDAAENAALKPLAEFFAMAHPIKAQAGQLAKLRRGNTDGTSVHVVSGDQAQQLAAQAGGFYAQARGVADFLLAESGEPSIFGDIARTVAEGSKIEQWLASRGDRFGLPDSLPGLQERWSAWLAALPDR